MNLFFTCASFLLSLTAFSQEPAKVVQVDSLVKLINSSDFKIQRDTVKQDHPELGLAMQTIMTSLTSGAELKKYINQVEIARQENGMTKQMIATNTFYFNQNKLIKVEEFVIDGEKQKDALWYFADNTLIHHTLDSENSKARAEKLVAIAKDILETFGFQ